MMLLFSALCWFSKFLENFWSKSSAFKSSKEIHYIWSFIKLVNLLLQVRLSEKFLSNYSKGVISLVIYTKTLSIDYQTTPLHLD